ncbi:hypothetical protein DYB32_002297 [Aphanomyces invadans]|uniref:PH domain-containing protein n=1 Tax=Aphanomyces invadans TaxID=157072 RepID=A0A418B3Q7_9STRA|nr:hypothetical protein DYB32_002297 [Aphanomyces invadans]
MHANTMATPAEDEPPTSSLSTTPRLSVTESGTWDDQYLPTHAGSRTLGLLKGRTLDNQKSKLTKNTPQERFSRAQVAFEGSLVKQGSFWRTWRKRWFILRSDRPLFSYYKSSVDLELLGEVVLDATTTIEVLPGTPGHFCIKTKNRRLMLSAHDDGGVPYMDRWIAALNVSIRQCFTPVDGAQAFPPFRTINDDNFTHLHVDVKQIASSKSPEVDSSSNTTVSTSPILIPRLKQAMTISQDDSTAPLPFVRRTNSLQTMSDTRDSRTIGSSSKLLTAMVSTSWTNRNCTAKQDSHQTNALTSLSLTHVLPPPSLHFAVSFGSEQDAAVQGLLVVSLSALENAASSMTELSRTEVECTQSVRRLGDRWVRDFQGLLALPVSMVDANVVLQFDVFGITAPATESLKAQTPLGAFTIATRDLVADSDDGTPLLLDLHPREYPATSSLFLIVEQVSTPEALRMDHVYHFASHQYLVDATVWPNTPPPSATTPPSSPRMHSLRSAAATRGQTQVHVTEEMGASCTSLSVVVAFIKMLQQRNHRRKETAKRMMEEIECRDVTRSSITSPTSAATVHLSSPVDPGPVSPVMYTEASSSQGSDSASSYAALKARVDECDELKIKYMQAERRYAALRLMLQEGEEHGITSCLKRSTMKKDETMEFMPTNLVCHSIRGGDRLWAVVTHGCSAAHLHGFKDGGLRKKSKGHEHRLDVVSCQLMAVVATAFLTSVHLALDPDNRWPGMANRYFRTFEIAALVGYLVDIESLLSTMGNEKGMLEDMSEGVQWLNQHVYIQVTPCEGATVVDCSSIALDGDTADVVMAFSMPQRMYFALPLPLQTPRRVKVTTVLFTQGINEVQSVANTVGNPSLQDEINRESLMTLNDYINRYIPHISRDQVDELDRQRTALRNAVDNQCNRKQVNILIESSELCRRLGAGRTTCCKSGKDRTAMSVTLEFSKILVDELGVKQGMHLCQTMREIGVRRTNVLVNTGKTMYAFNALQLK